MSFLIRANTIGEYRNGVSTCGESLLDAGVCCAEHCRRDARWAVLVRAEQGLVEHAVCDHHLPDDFLGLKDYVPSALWGGGL